MGSMKILLGLLAAMMAMAAQAQTPSIRLYASDSLRPAFDELAAGYTAARIEVVSGSQRELRSRIAAGERPQLFAATGIVDPHALAQAGLAGPVKFFARSGGSHYGLVLVGGSEDLQEDALRFVRFVLSPAGQDIVARHGLSRGASALLAGK